MIENGRGLCLRLFDLAVKNTTEKVFLNDELWRSGVRISGVSAHQKVILRMKCVEWLFIMSGILEFEPTGVHASTSGTRRASYPYGEAVSKKMEHKI